MESWRNISFRRNVIDKIEEEITKLKLVTTKSSIDLENEEYQKATSKEDYLKLIALLIIRLRQKSAAVNQLSNNENKVSHNIPSSSKNYQTFTCAVCCSNFISKKSIKDHLRRASHGDTNSSTFSSITSLNELPQQWPYTLCNTSDNQIEMHLPTIHSVTQTQDWMSEFMKLNQCAYAWERTCWNDDHTQQEIVYCCQFFEKKVKNTCNRKISFIIDLVTSSATATIENNHDHSVNNYDPRIYNPSPEVKKTLLNFFEMASNPVEAYRNFQIQVEMQLNNEQEYEEYVSDKRKMPSLSWVRQLYHLEYQTRNSIGKNDLDLLKTFIDGINIEHPDCSCRFQELPNNNFVIFIVTAYMKRALKSRAAGELVYTDNIGSTARYGLKIYLLMTNLKNEAIPVAVIITSSETSKAIKTGFNLLSTSIDDHSFNRRGRLGPAIIMTDDSIAEMASMKNLFPYSKTVVSVLHFLQSSYKWLLKIEHKINKDDRETIYACIRRMVYAENEIILRKLFDELVDAYKSQELISTYVCKLYEKRQTWALCFRQNVVLESQANEWKRSLCIFREQIMNEIKLQEPKKLILYFLDEFPNFYEKRLIDCILNKCDVQPLYHSPDSYEFTRSQHCESFYTVRNQSTGVRYLINTDINSCTCYVGSAGMLCEHQKALMAIMNKSDTDSFTNDIHYETELYYIISGCENLPQEFFSLSNPNSEHIENQFDSDMQETIIYDTDLLKMESDSNPQNTQCPEVTDQVYPIIINNVKEDDSVLRIEECSTLDDCMEAFSCEIDESTDHADIIEVLPVETDNVICLSLEDDISEINYIDESNDEMFDSEYFQFFGNISKFCSLVKNHPEQYKDGLIYLNKQLTKLKNNPQALRQALNSWQIQL